MFKKISARLRPRKRSWFDAAVLLAVALAPGETATVRRKTPAEGGGAAIVIYPVAADPVAYPVASFGGESRKEQHE